ncbi:group I intron endonuclease [Fictibacillus enclensis]|uniref:LuxR family transcriptional regulator n=1 Tax=Fictibacillus enclensis TaxID=1017270 RepID=A0A0V8J7S8_9BACL|nr:GIY-YIG nuclease family protein [Fictibacillus enclensis]KSU83250.1 LuxR family transcriptional regulator [Fictibacillus enclensis]SCC12497.1 group I intron endonuclease [Fictibacillus enclensis]
MNRKKELKQQYLETKIEAGVYAIKNTVNHKVFVGSTRNLKTLNGRKFELEQGSSTNRELQADWNFYGKDAFQFEVLETLEKKETGYFNEKRELEVLEDKWLQELKPFGSRGYNKEKPR